MNRYIGALEMPVMVAKAFGPKYSALIATVKGFRPPKPAPNNTANRIATGILWAKTAKVNPAACMNPNTATATLVSKAFLFREVFPTLEY